MLKLKYKLNGGYAPKKMTKGSACYDLYTPEDVIIHSNITTVIDLKVAFEIPEGYYMMIYPRSSLLPKYNLIMPPTIVDNDYRQNVHAIMYNGRESFKLNKGTRICQIVLVGESDVELEETDIEETTRGGIGSTDAIS